jgi:hypothetical protein
MMIRVPLVATGFISQDLHQGFTGFNLRFQFLIMVITEFDGVGVAAIQENQAAAGQAFAANEKRAVFGDVLLAGWAPGVLFALVTQAGGSGLGVDKGLSIHQALYL